LAAAAIKGILYKHDKRKPTNVLEKMVEILNSFCRFACPRAFIYKI
jgi:hypothetical protein